jgi:hypothetical protein
MSRGVSPDHDRPLPRPGRVRHARAGDRRQLGAARVVGPEAALARRKAMPDAGPLELEPRHGLEVAQ